MRDMSVYSVVGVVRSLRDGVLSSVEDVALSCRRSETDG
jgi:hypothetical protein